MAVHGGAWNIPDILWPAHRLGCERARARGLAVLEAGGSAVDAVEQAIKVMEDDPVFDAGFGSFLNEDGQVETDAGLMEGSRLLSGAVLCVDRLKNPISLARWVMENSEHCVFAGEGAHRLARRAGFKLIDPESLVLERERERLRRLRSDPGSVDDVWTEPGFDTVGAIALDREGRLAAGNSTGGTPNKAVGRIGDAPLMGLGFYADNQMGAFVCTGWGEPIMRSAMGLRALYMVGVRGPQEAAESAIDYLKERVDGYGGILLMAPDGRCGVSYNTQRMAFAL